MGFWWHESPESPAKAWSAVDALDRVGKTLGGRASALEIPLTAKIEKRTWDSALNAARPRLLARTEPQFGTLENTIDDKRSPTDATIDELRLFRGTDYEQRRHFGRRDIRPEFDEDLPPSCTVARKPVGELSDVS